jgi:DNA-binding beta-propeller fold protein YncE
MGFHRALRLALAALVLLGVASHAGAQGRLYSLDSRFLKAHDPETLTQLATVDLSVIGQPHGIAVGAKGTRIYVGLAGSGAGSGSGSPANAVAVVDAASMTVLRTIPVGAGPAWLIASPDGSRIYVTSSGDATIRAIRTSDDAIIGTVQGEGIPRHLAISRDGSQLFVLSIATGTVSRIATSTLSVTARFASGAASPRGIAVNADGTRVFVTDRSNSRTVAVDVGSQTTVGSIQGRNIPVHPAITPGGKLYITADNGSDFGGGFQPVTVANASTLAEITTVNAFGTSYAAVSESGSRAYFQGMSGNGSSFQARLTAVDTATDTVIQSISVGGAINGIAVAPDDACTFAIAPLQTGIPLGGGSVTLTVPAPQGCGWSIPSPAPWLTPASPTSGVGPGSVTFTAAPATDPRSTEFRVNGQVIPVFQTEPLVLIDNLPSGVRVTQPFNVDGWAIERAVAAPGGDVLGGVNSIHLWAYPASGNPIFVGETTPFRSRPDIGAIYGSAYTSAGFSVPIRGLSPGTYTFVAFLFSRATKRFDAVSTTIVTIDPRTLIALDTLAPGAQVTTPFHIGGWAIDGGATSDTGVDAVHVYAYPDAGGGPVFLGSAALGLSRGDIAALAGSQFEKSGFALAGDGLAPGGYTIVAYAHSTVSGAFAPAVVHISVTGSAEPFQIEHVFTNVGPQQILIIGWAMDRRAASGTGVSSIHFYAYPAGGGNPIFVGSVTPSVPRAEVEAMFGSRFRNAGFSLAANLASGSYQIVGYALSAATGRFDNVRLKPVIVP